MVHDRLIKSNGKHCAGEADARVERARLRERVARVWLRRHLGSDDRLKEAHAGGGTTMSVFRRDTSISALPRVWKHDASGDVLQGVCTRRQTDTSAGDYEEGRNETYEPGA